MSRTEENRLVARAKRGHADAFRTIVETYKDRLHLFVSKMVRNHHEAEDICQSAFVKAYESLASYNASFAFSTWLFTIAYRLCLNHLRKKKALSGETDFSHTQTAATDVAESVARSEEARHLKDRIWAAVETLSPAQRSAVLLFYCENKSCQEIGVVLGMPPVTVKSHLHRARAKLRDLLSTEALEAGFNEDWQDTRTARLA